MTFLIHLQIASSKVATLGNQSWMSNRNVVHGREEEKNTHTHNS